ncbi:MAG TPA: alkaline phosphatase family protein [Candidatus Elarobacter sp.]|jgi:phospholipase C|nr:alkaline phosphatase family protein [Candidatus Elarobacter sp.]
MTLRFTGALGVVTALVLAGSLLVRMERPPNAALAAPASPIKHVVVIVQENRTPDNLFYGLCAYTRRCAFSPFSPAQPARYDIRTTRWPQKGGPAVEPVAGPLVTSFDLNHAHAGFVNECDRGPSGCRMDGAQKRGYGYVRSSDVQPYLELAAGFGWANAMFQSNQGPSYPAHQYLFGATSAPSAADDAAGIFVAENLNNTGVGGLRAIAGCGAPKSTRVRLIKPSGAENTLVYPCFEHQALPDVLGASVTWRYYAPKPGMIWTAPNSIRHFCNPTATTLTIQECSGPEWTEHLDFRPAGVLSDVAACDLRAVSWVIPSAANSDHANVNNGNGPSWVASIVNAIGTADRCDGGEGYWKDTAIVLTWDDWGGWYDHVPPPVRAMPQGDYEVGFRVPLIIISAYTPKGYINNGVHDFGSIARLIEHTFGTTEGALGFDDRRATTDLSGFFNFRSAPRAFAKIAAPKSAAAFVHDTRPPGDPDDD